MDPLKTGWRKTDAKMAVATGAIIGYVAEKTEDGWLLRLITHPALPAPEEKIYLIDFRRQEPRVFAKIDSLLENAAELGFDVSQITSLSLASKVKTKKKAD